jgi:hypothetical protein
MKKSTFTILLLAFAFVGLGSVTFAGDFGKHKVPKKEVTVKDMSYSADVAIAPAMEAISFETPVASMSLNTSFSLFTEKFKSNLKFVSRHLRCKSNGLVIFYNSHPKKFATICTVRYLSTRADA